MAWSAVEQKYEKNDKHNWVQKALRQTASIEDMYNTYRAGEPNTERGEDDGKTGRKEAITEEPQDLLVLYILSACEELTALSLSSRANDDKEGGLLRKPLPKKRFDARSEAGLDVLLSERVGHGDGEG